METEQVYTRHSLRLHSPAAMLFTPKHAQADSLRISITKRKHTQCAHTYTNSTFENGGQLLEQKSLVTIDTGVRISFFPSFHDFSSYYYT